MYQSTSTQKIAAHEELIISLFNTIDAADWQLLAQHFDKSITYQSPGYKTLIGIDQLLHFYQYDRVIASGKHHIQHIVVSEDYGSCWGQFIGVHKNSSSISEGFADVYSFENSKLKTRRSYFFRPAI